jgi:hypothetical protein
MDTLDGYSFCIGGIVAFFIMLLCRFNCFRLNIQTGNIIGGRANFIASMSSSTGSIVHINGQRYTLPPCKNVSMVNNKIYLDDVLYQPKPEDVTTFNQNLLQSKKVDLHIHCDEKNSDLQVTAHGCDVHVSGNARHVNTMSGNIIVHYGVSGSVKTTSGGVDVSGSIGGSVVTTSGDVNVSGGIGGSVKTLSGDISN